jgi:hypothetical protein
MLNRKILTAFAKEGIQWLQNEMISAINNGSDAFVAFLVVNENPHVRILFGDTLPNIMTPNHLKVLNRLLGHGHVFDDQYYDATTAFRILNRLVIDDGTEAFVINCLDNYCMDMNFILGVGAPTPRTHFFDVQREAQKEYVADENNMVSVNQTVFGKDRISVHDMRLYKFVLSKYNQNVIDHYLKSGFEDLIFDVIWHTRQRSDKWTSENYGLRNRQEDTYLDDQEVKFKHMLGRLTNDTETLSTIFSLIANQSDGNVQHNWEAATDIVRRGGNQPSNYSNLASSYNDYTARKLAEYYRNHPEDLSVRPENVSATTFDSNNDYTLFIFLLSMAVIAAAARPAYRALKKAGLFADTNRYTAVAQDSELSRRLAIENFSNMTVISPAARPAYRALKNAGIFADANRSTAVAQDSETGRRLAIENSSKRTL